MEKEISTYFVDNKLVEFNLKTSESIIFINQISSSKGASGIKKGVLLVNIGGTNEVIKYIISNNYTNENLIQNIHRECRIINLITINCKHVVKYLACDFKYNDNKDLIILIRMEYIPGKPLDLFLKEIKKQGSKEQLASYILQQGLEALVCLHSNKLVNKNINPNQELSE